MTDVHHAALCSGGTDSVVAATIPACASARQAVLFPPVRDAAFGDAACLCDPHPFQLIDNVTQHELEPPCTQ